MIPTMILFQTIPKLIGEMNIGEISIQNPAIALIQLSQPVVVSVTNILIKAIAAITKPTINALLACEPETLKIYGLKINQRPAIKSIHL
jgi:hypothetical protein